MEYVSKVVFCGDGMVGKSILSKQFVGLNTSGRYLMTIGADLLIKHTTVKIGEEIHSVRFFLWDLAGQQAFRNVRPHYYRGSQAAFFVYDITNRTSFENIDNWVKEVQTHNKLFPIPMILVANKIDLKGKVDNWITRAEGIELLKILTEKYFKSQSITIFMETSALTGENVDMTFDVLAKLFINNSR